jgi:hypothetical protein
MHSSGRLAVEQRLSGKRCGLLSLADCLYCRRCYECQVRETLAALHFERHEVRQIKRTFAVLGKTHVPLTLGERIPRPFRFVFCKPRVLFSFGATPSKSLHRLGVW